MTEEISRKYWTTRESAMVHGATRRKSAIRIGTCLAFIARKLKGFINIASRRLWPGFKNKKQPRKSRKRGGHRVFAAKLRTPLQQGKTCKRANKLASGDEQESDDGGRSRWIRRQRVPGRCWEKPQSDHGSNKQVWFSSPNKLEGLYKIGCSQESKCQLRKGIHDSSTGTLSKDLEASQSLDSMDHLLPMSDQTIDLFLQESNVDPTNYWHAHGCTPSSSKSKASHSEGMLIELFAVELAARVLSYMRSAWMTCRVPITWTGNSCKQCITFYCLFLHNCPRILLNYFFAKPAWYLLSAAGQELELCLWYYRMNSSLFLCIPLTESTQQELSWFSKTLWTISEIIYHVLVHVLHAMLLVASWVLQYVGEFIAKCFEFIPRGPAGVAGFAEFEVDISGNDIAGESMELEKIKQSLRLKVVYVNSNAGKAGEGRNDQDGLNCTVCLAEIGRFGEDLVYELPRCDHVFHKACLDGWLAENHTDCPLCRSSLTTAEPATSNLQCLGLR